MEAPRRQPGVWLIVFAAHAAWLGRVRPVCSRACGEMMRFPLGPQQEAQSLHIGSRVLLLHGGGKNIFWKFAPVETDTRGPGGTVAGEGGPSGATPH